jgi:hypothetical protein
LNAHLIMPYHLRAGEGDRALPRQERVGTRHARIGPPTPIAPRASGSASRISTTRRSSARSSRSS